MAEHTQNFQLPYPLSSYAPAGAEQIHELADAVDAALTASKAGGDGNSQTIANLETRVNKLQVDMIAMLAQAANQVGINKDLVTAGWLYTPVIYKLTVRWSNGKKLKKGDAFTVTISNLTTHYNPAITGDHSEHQTLSFYPDVIMSRYGGSGNTQYIRMQPYGSGKNAAGHAEFKVLITIDTEFSQADLRKYKAYFQVSNRDVRGGFAGVGSPLDPDKLKAATGILRSAPTPDESVLTSPLPVVYPTATVTVVPGTYGNDDEGVVNIEIP